MWVVVSTTDSCSHVSFDVHRRERERERERPGARRNCFARTHSIGKKLKGLRHGRQWTEFFFFFEQVEVHNALWVEKGNNSTTHMKSANKSRVVQCKTGKHTSVCESGRHEKSRFETQ